MADANAIVVDGAADVKVKLCCSHFPSVGLIPATLWTNDAGEVATLLANVCSVADDTWR